MRQGQGRALFAQRKFVDYAHLDAHSGSTLVVSAGCIEDRNRGMGQMRILGMVRTHWNWSSLKRLRSRALHWYSLKTHELALGWLGLGTRPILTRRTRVHRR